MAAAEGPVSAVRLGGLAVADGECFDPVRDRGRRAVVGKAAVLCVAPCPCVATHGTPCGTPCAIGPCRAPATTP